MLLKKQGDKIVLEKPLLLQSFPLQLTKITGVREVLLQQAQDKHKDTADLNTAHLNSWDIYIFCSIHLGQHVHYLHSTLSNHSKPTFLIGFNEI